MNQCNPSGGFLELRPDPRGHRVRHDLSRGTGNILFRDLQSWSLDTRQYRVSGNLIHFVAPDGEILGIKTFSGAQGDE